MILGYISAIHVCKTKRHICAVQSHRCLLCASTSTRVKHCQKRFMLALQAWSWSLIDDHFLPLLLERSITVHLLLIGTWTSYSRSNQTRKCYWPSLHPSEHRRHEWVISTETYMAPDHKFYPQIKLWAKRPNPFRSWRRCFHLCKKSSQMTSMDISVKLENDFNFVEAAVLNEEWRSIPLPRKSGTPHQQTFWNWWLKNCKHLRWKSVLPPLWQAGTIRDMDHIMHRVWWVSRWLKRSANIYYHMALIDLIGDFCRQGRFRYASGLYW